MSVGGARGGAGCVACMPPSEKSTTKIRYLPMAACAIVCTLCGGIAVTIATDFASNCCRIK